MENLDIRNIRKKAGLTQQELASSLNVSRNTIVNWERGFTQPKPSIINFMENTKTSIETIILSLGKLSNLLKNNAPVPEELIESINHYGSLIGQETGYELNIRQNSKSLPEVSKREDPTGLHFIHGGPYITPSYEKLERELQIAGFKNGNLSSLNSYQIFPSIYYTIHRHGELNLSERNPIQEKLKRAIENNKEISGEISFFGQPEAFYNAMQEHKQRLGLKTD